MDLVEYAMVFFSVGEEFEFLLFFVQILGACSFTNYNLANKKKNLPELTQNTA